MRLDDGSEVLVTLALPLDAGLAAHLMLAIDTAARERGYNEVSMLTDGSNRIVARRAEECRP
jgi:hypothetical protein